MGCSKHHTPSIYESTKIIAHRGNGSVGSGLGQYEENTVDACISRFSLVDGVEVDVQRSNDYLVYLYHDTQVEACSEHDIKSIAASAQDKINDQFDCLGKRPNTLAQLFDYTSTQNENKDIMQFIKDNKDKIHKPKDNVDLCRLLEISFPNTKGRIHNYADKGIQVYVYK